MDKFEALSEPTRRKILEMLARETSQGSGLPVVNEKTGEAAPGPQAFSDRTRQR